MVQRLLQILLTPVITNLAHWWISTPSRQKVHAALDHLFNVLKTGSTDNGCTINVDLHNCRIVIVSDQHKGTRNNADDFNATAPNFNRALNYYFEKGFTLINNGDAEELWENTPAEVIEKNKETLTNEARFLAHNRYYRIWGNHDMEWKYSLPRARFLEPILGHPLPVYEGVLIQTTYRSLPWTFFITHGHQGDHTSDGNPFSAWFVARIWTPLQRYLGIRLDTTSSSYALVDRHNIIMNEWIQKKSDVILITGHTHKPVFASMDHIDRLHRQLEEAKKQSNNQQVVQIEEEIQQRKKEYKGKGIIREKNKPAYFNTGCCCYADGDMTCIEWEGEKIRLVKWQQKGKESVRIVLEESLMSSLLEKMNQYNQKNTSLKQSPQLFL